MSGLQFNNMKYINKILVSVIMCVYNTPKNYLVCAVKSILKQTHTNFELLIVDDCSNKDLYLDKLFTDRRITIIRNTENRGAAYSRNRALDIAKGKYIAIMDSDDYSLPTRFEEQIQFLEKNKDVVVCGTWFKHFGAKTNEVKREIDDNEYYRCCLLFSNYPTLLNPSTMIRKEIIDEHNIRYNDELRLGEDYCFWVDISRHGKITNLKKILVHYRIHESQITNNNARRRQSLLYDSLVRRIQINRLGLVLTDKEKEIVSKDFTDKKVKAKAYYQFLNRLSDANHESKYFDEGKLAIRVKEQWIKKIQATNNLFVLFDLFCSLRQERQTIISTKKAQIKHKLWRKEW